MHTASHHYDTDRSVYMNALVWRPVGNLGISITQHELSKPFAASTH